MSKVIHRHLHLLPRHHRASRDPSRDRIGRHLLEQDIRPNRYHWRVCIDHTSDNQGGSDANPVLTRKQPLTMPPECTTSNRDNSTAFGDSRSDRATIQGSSGIGCDHTEAGQGGSSTLASSNLNKRPSKKAKKVSPLSPDLAAAAPTWYLDSTAGTRGTFGDDKLNISVGNFNNRPSSGFTIIHYHIDDDSGPAWTSFTTTAATSTPPIVATGPGAE